MRRKIWPCLAAVSLAISASWSHAQPGSPGANLEQQLVHLDTALAAGTRCGWFTPIEKQGLEAALRQSRAAILAAKGPAGLAAAEAADKTALEPADTLNCTSPSGVATRLNVEPTVQEVVTTHLFRAEQIAKFDAPWAKGVARLSPSSEAVVEAAAKLRAANPQRWDQVAAVNSPNMTMAVLALNCRERKGPKANCPSVGTPSPQDMAFVRGWLSDTESFAEAYLATAKPAS